MVLGETLESLLDLKEIKPDNPKGNQSWTSTGKTDAEAEAPVFWLPDVKNWLIREDSDAGKDWRHKEKGTTEDEMVGLHHQLDGHELEKALGFDEWTGKPGMPVNGIAKSQTWLSIWTEQNWVLP